jgi:TetR/AcrR family transcriptional regulator, mexJK operon transcriptional repressor
MKLVHCQKNVNHDNGFNDKETIEPISTLLRPSTAATMALMSETRSEVVLRAATRVFLSHGFSAATTDMIQREANVSKATLYAHYGNKERLFAAVVQRACEEFTAGVRAITPAPGKLETTLQDLGRAHLNMVLSPGGLALFRVVMAEAPRFPELGRVFYLAGPRVSTEVVASHLRVAVQAGELDLQSVGVEQAAILFLSLLRGEGQMVCLTHPESTPSAAQIDHWVNVATQTFVAAFGRRS